MTELPRATTAPRAKGLPFIGSALDLYKDPYGWWAAQYRQHGAVFRLTLPIEGRTWIGIAGREANALLAEEGHRLFSQKMTYPKAPKVLETDLHPSITEGALQRHLRRQVAPGFSRQAAEPHLPAMTTWVREYIDHWAPNDRFQVTEETSRLGLNCVSFFATGEPLGIDSEAVRKYATVFTGVIATSWPFTLLKWPSVNRARRGLDAMLADRLERHRAVPPGEARPPDYFDLLLQGTLPDGEPLPERVQVVFGQIPFKNMGVYAGRVINHVLYQLVSRPEVLARVQPEIDRVFADDEVTVEEVASMSAMRATIFETLRTLPIAVALQRTVCAPFDFGGYRFEVGDKLFTPISVTHFLPEFFPDPEVFNIDRFMPDRSEHLQPYVFNPFGLGHHACVSRGVFELITVIVVGTILHRWRLEAGYKLRSIVDALPGPWTGHTMRVVERREVAPPAGKRRRSPTHRISMPAQLLDAVDRAPTLTFEPGHVLFREGEAADHVYLVLAGKIVITKSTTGRAGSEAVPVATLGAGEILGEIGVLHHAPRLATATVEASAQIVVLDGDLFRQAVSQEDVMARELADLMLRRRAGAVLGSLLESGRAAELIGKGQARSFDAQPGEVLIRQGEAATHFYLLVAGDVDVAIERASGDAVPLGRLHAPDCFGEIAMLDDRPRTATVRVAPNAPAHLIALDRAAFDGLAKDPESRAALELIAEQRQPRPE